MLQILLVSLHLMIQMHVHAGPFFDYYFFRMGVTIVVVKIKGGVTLAYISITFIIFYIDLSDLCDVL